MEITCTQCGFKADAPDFYKGRKVRCPQCQNIFVCGEIKPTFIVMDDLEDVTAPKTKAPEQTPVPEQTQVPEQQQTVPQHSITTDDAPVSKIAVSSIPKSSVIHIKQPTYEKTTITPQASSAGASAAPSTPTPSAPPVSSEAVPQSSVAREVKLSVASNAPKNEVPIAEYHCGNTQLSLTSRHLMGEIETLVESGKSRLGGEKTYLTRRENISVLLSNISSYTLTNDAENIQNKKAGLRITAALIFIIILLKGARSVNLAETNTGITILISSLLPSLLLLCAVKFQLHHYLTIKVGEFEYKIPITNETTKDCLAFLGKLKTAKMAFEESI